MLPKITEFVKNRTINRQYVAFTKILQDPGGFLR